MNNIVIRLLPLVMSVMLLGCNSDIFTDDSPGPSHPTESNLDILVGTEAGFSFSVNGIMDVEVEFFSQRYDCVKYLPSGDVFASYTSVSDMMLYKSSSTQPFITRLTASSSDADFEILGDPTGHISVKSVRNDSGLTLSGCFNLVYPDRNEKVTFNFLPANR